MNRYVTGAMIKKLREGSKMTQSELAQKLSVSDKAVSKWETGKGYPDITLIEPLAKALDISVMELLADLSHELMLEPVEDEYYVTLSHPMTKEHYISFLAAVGDNGLQVVKLYPEGSAEARFKCSRIRLLYAYCNRHGLFKRKV